MPTENGYSNQKKKGQSQFKTINQVGSNQFGNPISQKTLFDKTVAAIAITAVTDVLGVDGQVEFWNVTLPSHTASKNDVMRMITGTLLAWEYDIIQVIDANNFYILPISDTKPIVAETAKVLGWTTSKSSQEGELVVVVAPSPVAFVLDGVDTEVEQDTAVAANNRSLPSQLFIYKDGVQIPITKDTGTPANTVGVPVEIVAASGTPINITAGDINVQLTDLGVNFDSVRVGDGSGNYIGVNASDEALVHDADVLAQAVLLVAKDFATSAKQDSALTAIGLLAKLTDTQPVSGPLTDTQLRASAVPVSLASIPLGTGAATEAKQDTQITAAGSTNTKLDTLIAKDFATSAKQDTGNTSLGSIDTKLSSQATATNQTSTNTKLDTIITNTTSIATAANQTTTNTRLGDLTETAPASDTASSGLNGRLQRIAQRITSLIALIPTSLGQKTMANSFAVTLASDQPALPTTETAMAATYQEDLTVGAGAETFTAPANAKWCKIYADDTNTVNIRVKIGGTATTSSGIQFQPGRSEDYFAVGNISYISESTTGQKLYVQFGA